MTQSPEQGTVGEPSAITDAPGTDTLDHAAAAFGDLADLPEAPLDPNNPEEPADEPEGEEPEDDEQQEEPEEPAIDPPVSWKAEDKELFKSLPPEVQKTISERETERERFVQSKSQEAANVRATVENEARAVIAQQAQQAAQQLRQYEAMFQPQEPDAAYAKSQFDAAIAQRHQAQQTAAQYEAEAQAQRQHIEQAQQRAEVEALRTNFPEWFDPSAGANHQQQLTAIAREMGYSDEHVTQARAVDILAMRRAADWKAKADKFDALNKSKMETVREAKKLPTVTRPGVAQQPGSGKARERAASMDRLRQSGSLDDAAAALARL